MTKNFDDLPYLGVRGSWRADEATGELIEQPAADSYAERVERERRVSRVPSLIVRAT